VRQYVSLQVIDIDKGYVQGKCHTFGERGTNQERTQQSRTAGERDRRDIFFPHPCPLEGRVYDRQDVLLVRTTRQFGYYSTELLMHFLARNHITAQDPVHDHRRRRVVTTRLNTYYYDRFIHFRAQKYYKKLKAKN
jgi:hypothetical protein